MPTYLRVQVADQKDGIPSTCQPWDGNAASCSSSSSGGYGQGGQGSMDIRDREACKERQCRREPGWLHQEGTGPAHSHEVSPGYGLPKRPHTLPDSTASPGVIRLHALNSTKALTQALCKQGLPQICPAVHACGAHSSMHAPAARGGPRPMLLSPGGHLLTRPLNSIY